MPADALWTFAMACNVYLSFFRQYDMSQLRGLEWKYLGGCYGIPFVPALVFLFVSSGARGKVYGDAVVRVLQMCPPFLILILANATIAMVLGVGKMERLEDSSLLRTRLARHYRDRVHLRQSRPGCLSMAQAPAFPRSKWHQDFDADE